MIDNLILLHRLLIQPIQLARCLGGLYPLMLSFIHSPEMDPMPFGKLLQA
jgi:hypothetical protein